MVRDYVVVGTTLLGAPSRRSRAAVVAGLGVELARPAGP
jgi:hypothetical protein